jgi:hypothetical protein
MDLVDASFLLLHAGKPKMAMKRMKREKVVFLNVGVIRLGVGLKKMGIK